MIEIKIKPEFDVGSSTFRARRNHKKIERHYKYGFVEQIVELRKLERNEKKKLMKGTINNVCEEAGCYITLKHRF